MDQYIPYGRQSVDAEDIDSVVRVLKGDWLTTGPAVDQFEQAVAEFVGVSQAVAVSSGTAALHAAMHAIGVGPGDEVIVSPMTFAASANAILYVGATPVFADVDPATLLICPAAVEKKITPQTKAIIAVDYAGQPCDYKSLKNLAEKFELLLVADACHSLGASWQGAMCGAQADLSVFSFHPVKPITTAEGGMVVTDDKNLADRVRTFRNHGIATDHRQRNEKGVWFYEMTELGYNYRLSDLQSVLGVSQLKKLPKWISRRNEIARRYDKAFSPITSISPLGKSPDMTHGYHLYVVRVPHRDAVFKQLRNCGIGCNLHYIPVHLHPYYQDSVASAREPFSIAEKAYSEILSLPIYPSMTNAQIERVIQTMIDTVKDLVETASHE